MVLLGLLLFCVVGWQVCSLTYCFELYLLLSVFVFGCWADLCFVLSWLVGACGYAYLL